MKRMKKKNEKEKRRKRNNKFLKNAVTAWWGNFRCVEVPPDRLAGTFHPPEVPLTGCHRK
jgi:hypothetical protein